MSPLVLSAVATNWLLAGILIGASAVGLWAAMSLRHEARGGTAHAHADGTVHEHAGGHRHHEHPTFADKYEGFLRRVFRETETSEQGTSERVVW